MVALEVLIELEDKLSQEYIKTCELVNRGIYSTTSAKNIHHCLNCARDLYKVYILAVEQQIRELKEGVNT